jgi:DNA-binding LacI/PurR family transcriptional regulator
VSLIGFDNIQWSALTVPPLTTVAQDIDTICYNAVTALDEAVNQGRSLETSIELIPPSLIERGSTVKAVSTRQVRK